MDQKKLREAIEIGGWVPYQSATKLTDNMSIVFYELGTRITDAGYIGIRIAIRHEEEEWRYPGLLHVPEFEEFCRDDREIFAENSTLMNQDPKNFAKITLECMPIKKNNYIDQIDISWQRQTKGKRHAHALTFNALDMTLGHGFIWLEDPFRHIKMVQKMT